MLYFTKSGSGFPFVLLHGNGEDSSFFKNQIDYFSKKYRVIAVDTRGHGKSPRGTAPFSLYQFADDLKELLDRMEIKSINLLGFSDGANIALIFALKYPSYVSALILNSANLYPCGLCTSFLIPVKILYGIFSFFCIFTKKAAGRKELLALMVNEPHIVIDELKSLEMPVLVIAGTHDLIKKSHTELIAHSVPFSTLCFIDGGHGVAASNSGKFNKAVGEFLDKNIKKP